MIASSTLLLMVSVAYNVTHHGACGLTSAGLEDTECMANMHAKYNNVADVSCWVDKRVLPDCGSAGDTNTCACVSSSGPEWDIGAWVCCLPLCLRSWLHCHGCHAMPWLSCFAGRILISVGFQFGVILGGLLFLGCMIHGCIIFTKKFLGCIIPCCRDFLGQFSGESTSVHQDDEELAAAQRKHQEKCDALKKQLDDEKKSGVLTIKIEDSSGEICKQHVRCLVL